MIRRAPRPAPLQATGPALDEHTVVHRARLGDRESQQQLLMAHVGRVRRLVTRLLGGGVDVDDLVQATCVETLKSLPRFRGDASFALWMDRIATNVVYKHFRSNRRRRARISLVEDPDGAADALDTTRQVEWRHAIAQARALVDRLKPDRRIVFLLMSVDGRTVEEAAAILDLSVSATKSRYFRARRDVDSLLAERPELARLLGRRGEDPGHV